VTTSPPFIYVDVAIGGVYRPNDVRMVDELMALLKSLNGTADCFATFLRFSDELPKYAARNPSPTTGRPPSVSGFVGPALATFVPFDFDCADDLAKALTNARAFVHRLVTEYGVPDRAVRVFFSGNKGFSIELPAVLFGGFEPMVGIAERLKRIAVQLTSAIETVDMSIYETLRLWRIPNTRHGRSGLYKIPLSVNELITLEPADIWELARAPREIELPDEDEWDANTELAELWSKTAHREETNPIVRAEPLPLTISEGQRNTMLASVAGSMRRRGCSFDEILPALSVVNRRCDPPLALREPEKISESVARYRPDDAATAQSPTISVNDFYAYSPSHRYVFVPTRELWPAASVNSRIGVVDSAAGEPVKASEYLDMTRAVDQMTWLPGAGLIVEGRLVFQGGWIERPGAKVLNLYLPPGIKLGDATKAAPWLDLLYRVYPLEAEEIIDWLAHRVQKPQEKINHALVLGGRQGIGKDSLLEPIKYAVGPWNFIEVSPGHLFEPLNGYIKSVILRISEARDLGEVDRVAFYQHLKTYTAAPPDVLSCNEKNLREHAVFNVCGVIVTTNHKTDGIYLPEGDRRHFVAWSDLTRDDFIPEYWRELWSWYQSGGFGHVAAYLAARDISRFDAKAPPRKTPAFWEVVDVDRAPENPELADALESLGEPNVVTLASVINVASENLGEFLRDRRNSRKIPQRFEDAGYVTVRNDGDRRDGQWKIGGRRVTVYAKASLPLRDRIAAATALTDGTRRPRR
jgi:hypothetical protein